MTSSNKTNKVFKYLSAFFVLIFVFNFVRDIRLILDDTIEAMISAREVINLNYEEKMHRIYGPVFIYSKFINKMTDSNSRILIPPQGYPWPMTGNVLFFRYFVYPRQLINGGETSPNRDLIKDDIDYVMIAWGESEISEYGYTNGWPKFKVEAEEIILTDDLLIKNPNYDVIYRNYDPSDKFYENRWGLIKVK